MSSDYKIPGPIHLYAVIRVAFREMAADEKAKPKVQGRVIAPSFLLSISYFLPSRFCATTSPLGVGNKTTEMSPSWSMRKAASRTVLR